MPELDHVADERSGQPVCCVVDVMKDAGHACQTLETNGLEDTRAVCQKDKQKEELVFVGADEARPSSSLQRDRVDQVEGSVEHRPVDVQIGEYLFFAPLVKSPDDMVEEGGPCRDDGGLVGLVFTLDGVSFCRGLAQPSLQDVSRRRALHCKNL